jgi:EAL domain-containing protein (putative c-di-GMP-specific phosphodiesterase class I)/GGDEF domain-containing protein
MPEAAVRLTDFPLRVVMQDPERQRWQHEEIDLLEDIIDNRRLSAVFQPIIDFRSHAYIGFEGLIRGPASTPLHLPIQLFAAAERHGLRRKLERACRETVFRSFAQLQLPGKLFINASPDCLDDELFLNGGTLDLLHQIGISPNRVVIELTENQRVTDYPDIHRALSHFRSMGYQIAIDDLGEGFANLRMWSEIQPDFVKIDKHFINGIAEDNLKHHFVKAMQNLAESCSAKIVAEGIESEADCLAVRDLGIAFGQGYLIAMPIAEPRTLPSEKLLGVVKQHGIVVFPANSSPSGSVTVRSLTRPVEPATAHTFNDEVYRRFEDDPDLMSMPVVSAGTPLGLINRHEMVDRMARPYRRELFGKKPCVQFMDSMPLCIDESSTVQEAALIVSRSARHHIYDGFIVTRDGEYLGIGSAHDLMGMITEMQIQAARYANPLTQLPGNVPINEHIERLLERKIGFHACYFDIDHFKPFNDVFGYRKGDDIIVLLAQTMTGIINPRVDFCGHIGGDDFMVLFQSEDWEARCREALRLFDQRMADIVGTDLPPELLHGNGYLAENRRGQIVYYDLPSLSIGAVHVAPDSYESHREISAAAAEAKKNAKKSAGSSLFVERRQSPQ